MPSARTVSLLVTTLGSISAGAIRTYEGQTDTTRKGLEVLPDLIELIARSLCLHAHASEEELKQVTTYLKRLVRRYGTMRRSIEALGERRRRHRQISLSKVQSWAEVMGAPGMRVEAALRRHPPLLVSITRYISNEGPDLRKRLEAYLEWLDGPLTDLDDADQLEGLGAPSPELDPAPPPAPAPPVHVSPEETDLATEIFEKWFARKHLTEPTAPPPPPQSIAAKLNSLDQSANPFCRAVAAVARAQFQEADKLLLQARRQNADPRIDLLRAERFYLDRQYDAAADSYRLSREQIGATPSASVGLAMSLLHAHKGSHEQRIAEAIDLLTAAREQFPPESPDHAHASAMIAFARLHQPGGNRDRNVRLAIELFEHALSVITRERDPHRWADVHLHLGSAWQALPTGRKQENLQRAITCFTRAEEVWTQEAEPERWATVQNNLGHAWERLPGGVREVNLRRAIDYFSAALSVYDESAHPTGWATLKNNLGNAWVQFGAGDAGENIRRAIECHSDALRVWSRLDKRNEWAATQSNLGNAWALLPAAGPERERHLRKAISCYKSALEVRTRVASPHEWAATQNNLGSALLLLKEGDTSSTIREAIACFDRALEVRTRNASPLEWAKTQCNLGNAWALLTGPGHNNRDSLATACNHYRAALEVITQQAHPHQFGYVQSRLQAAQSQLVAG